MRKWSRHLDFNKFSLFFKELSIYRNWKLDLISKNYKLNYTSVKFTQVL